MRILSKNNLHHVLTFGTLSKTYRNTLLTDALKDFMLLTKEYKETQRKALETAKNSNTVQKLFQCDTIDFNSQIKNK
jgi:predicted RNA-binding protein with PUA domain